MKKFNLFSNFWSSLVGSQCSDIGFDCRLTVGSPSGRYASVISARVAQEWLKDKLVNLVKMVMQIFATSATFASANFLGKASCESTVRYREWSRIPSCFIRYASVIASTRIRLASLICLCMLTVGVGNAWGTTYTWTMASGDLGTNNSGATPCSPATSVSKGSPSAKSWSIDWTWVDNGNKYLGWDGTKGIQIGKKNYGTNTVVLSTSGISGTITSVTVNGSIAKDGAATIAVYVGSTGFTYSGNSTASLTTTATGYAFTGSASGSISITMTSSAEKAMYIKSIVVEYSSCTSLASINGSVSWSNGSKATLVWDKDANATGYVVKWKTHAGADNTYATTNVSTINDTLTTKKTCAIPSLTAGTEYDFKILITGKTSPTVYCDKDSVMTSRAPQITASATLTGSNYAYGSGPGTVKNFSVSGTGLTGDITVTAPTNFEVCKTSDGDYSSSVSYSPTSGTLSSTTVYIRLAAGLSENDYSGDVTISGGGAANNTSVSIAGTVSAACHTPSISSQPTSSASYNLNVSATALSVTAAKVDVGDPTLAYQWYSNTANSKTTPTPTEIDGANSSTYTPPTTAAGTKYYFCEVSSGACSLTSDISAITVNTPTLTIGDNKTSIDFGDKAKDGSYELSFTVSGSNLAKNTGISIGLSGTNASLFSIDKTSISQTSSGAVSSTTVKVTYSPNVAGNHSATLTISSTGATSKTIDLSGSSKWVVTWNVNGSTSSTTYVADNSKPTPPSAPADNTLNNCANKFVGWSCKSWGSTPKGTGTGEYDDLFTSSDYSTKGPSITKDTVLYAVFAESESGTGSLTQSEIQLFYCSGSGCVVSTNAYGSYTISSDDGNWSGVCCAATTGGGSPIYSININNGSTTVSGSPVTNHLESPTYSSNISNISITATHASSKGDRTIYICSGENASPSTSNLGTISVAKDNTSAQNIVPSSSVKSFYIYASDALQIRSITVSYGSSENYVTQCADNQVRVTYDFNGGTGTACTQGVTTKTESYTVCSTTPTKNYYDFAGWNDGTKTYAKGATYNLQATTTFTAQWTAHPYSITYNLNGGTQQVDPAAPTSYTYISDDVTLPTAPTKGHDRFEGWYANSDLSTGGVQTTIATGSYGDKEYWAKWETRHTIKFYADDVLLETLYRASDENLESSVTSQGSLPNSDPSAPTDCSSKVFMGWTETWFNDETDTEPADLDNDPSGTRTEDKTYYAVWATRSGSVGSYTYSAYSTTCCSKQVTLSDGSPSNGTVEFDYDYVWTCKGSRDVEMTVTPSSGYYLSAWSTSGVTPSSVSPAISSGSVTDDGAQVTTVTFAKNTTAGTYTASATFTAKPLTGWAWKYKKGNVGNSDPASAVPDVVEAYIGEYVRFIIDGYTPSDVINAKKGYVYINTEPKDLPVYNTSELAQVGKDDACTYYTTRGTKAVSSTTIKFKAVGDNTITKTFTLKINALPTVTFVDLIHNKVDFANSGDGWTAGTGVLSSTVSGGIVGHAKKTPKHTDLSAPATGNSCEKGHLHLMGWIRSDYDKVESYMAGERDALSISEITGAGTGYWFLPDADINTETYNGKIFYAVWAVEE